MGSGEILGNWEEWQHAHRFGVVLILPPEPVRSSVNALRGKYDPRSQSYCDAHISLTVPLPRAPQAGDWVELEAAALAVRSFSVHYGPSKPFLPNPGAAFHVEPQAEIDNLRRSLEASAIFAKLTQHHENISFGHT
jgi:hypothetical protein